MAKNVFLVRIEKDLAGGYRADILNPDLQTESVVVAEETGIQGILKSLERALNRIEGNYSTEIISVTSAPIKPYEKKKGVVEKYVVVTRYIDRFPIL